MWSLQGELTQEYHQSFDLGKYENLEQIHLIESDKMITYSTDVNKKGILSLWQSLDNIWTSIDQMDVPKPQLIIRGDEHIILSFCNDTLWYIKRGSSPSEERQVLIDLLRAHERLRARPYVTHLVSSMIPILKYLLNRRVPDKKRELLRILFWPIGTSKNDFRLDSVFSQLPNGLKLQLDISGVLDVVIDQEPFKTICQRRGVSLNSNLLGMFKGSWKNGCLEGEGTLIWNTTNASLQGIWKENVLMEVHKDGLSECLMVSCGNELLRFLETWYFSGENDTFSQEGFQEFCQRLQDDGLTHSASEELVERLQIQACLGSDVTLRSFSKTFTDFFSNHILVAKKWKEKSRVKVVVHSKLDAIKIALVTKFGENPPKFEMVFFSDPTLPEKTWLEWAKIAVLDPKCNRNPQRPRAFIRNTFNRPSLPSRKSKFLDLSRTSTQPKDQYALPNGKRDNM